MKEKLKSTIENTDQLLKNSKENSEINSMMLKTNMIEHKKQLMILKKNLKKNYHNKSKKMNKKLK